MTPGTFDLALYRGDSYSWTFKLWSDDDRTVPADLAGATAAAEVRDKPGGTKIVALDVTVTEPNLIDVRLPADLWNSPTPPIPGSWDLEVVFPGNEVRTVVAGKVKIAADVTNSTP